MFFKPKKLTSFPPIKAHVSLSHIKARHGYDFPLYFPHEFLMNYKYMYNELSIYTYIYIYIYLKFIVGTYI